MSLRAQLDGGDIVSIFCSEDAWSKAQAASKGTENRLRMSCCNAPAYASHSPLNLRYFAHKPGHKRCPSAGESDEHECLKAAAALAVEARPGWRAGIEVEGDRWRADVLAVRQSIKIAIELQLSSQAKRETGTRNARFEDSEVTPFWLKGKNNHVNDFGAGLQAAVIGKTVEAQMESVRKAVTNLLAAIERQVALANALARLLRRLPEWNYTIKKHGSVPAWLELQRGGLVQQVLLAELGPSLLPTAFRPKNGGQIGADQFAGAIVQLRIQARHLPGYQASSFQLNLRNLANSLARAMLPILNGEKYWRGKDNTESVPGSFVSYEEKCEQCGANYLRISHLLIGSPKHPEAMPSYVKNTEWRWYEPIIPQAEKFAQQKRMQLGPLERDRLNYSGAAVEQSCPQCRTTAPPPLISDEEALNLSPEGKAHFHIQLPVPGAGWSAETVWTDRPRVKSDQWERLVGERRAARQTERDEKQRQKENAEINRREVLAELRWRREEEEKAQIAEADRHAEELRRHREAARQAQLEAQRSERRQQLRRAAAKTFPDQVRCDLWLNSANPKLGRFLDKYAAKPTEVAEQSQAGLDATLKLLNSKIG